MSSPRLPDISRATAEMWLTFCPTYGADHHQTSTTTKNIINTWSLPEFVIQLLYNKMYTVYAYTSHKKLGKSEIQM